MTRTRALDRRLRRAVRSGPQARGRGSGQQLGDPVKAAQAMLAVIDRCPPAHLLLGSDALRLVRAKWAALQDDIRAWEPLTMSTDG
jgi:hypothetical protein